MIKKIVPIILLAFASTAIEAQTISEKKAGSAKASNELPPEMQKFLKQVNQELRESQDELHSLYSQVEELYNQEAPEDSYRYLLMKINAVKENIRDLEESWREMASQGSRGEEYALWHQPDITLGQLIMDYGSQDYVYLLPPEVASINLSVDSNLPIPRSSWNEMLEVILTQNGVGIKQLNPYLRQLYLLKQDRSTIRLITNNRKDLEILPGDTRVSFVLSPEPSDVKRIWLFLDKFINPNSTVLQMVGRDVLIIAPAADILDLLKLYDFVSTNRGDKEYKAITLKRVDVQEMARILGTIFDQLTESPQNLDRQDKGEAPDRRRPERGRSSNPERNPFHEKPMSGHETNGLRVIPLTHIAQAIFLVGTKEEIRKAEEIIREVEGQVGEAEEKVIYWYTTKNSDPAELATILEKVYLLMIQNRAALTGRNVENLTIPPSPDEQLPPPPVIQFPEPPSNIAQPFPPRNIFDDGFYLDSNHIVDSGFREGAPVDIANPNRNRNNFIVDLKTGSIVMVVEAEILPKLKDLIRKLDIPKKMVQIEVMLFEKRISHRDAIGLKLLNFGRNPFDPLRAPSNTNVTGVDFNGITGITDFFISRRSHSGIPAFDALYQFLISQDDVTINASPSILALNQTEARIAIEDEISINTGIFEIPTTGAVALKDAFARARYGIKIEIIPTVHMACEDEDGILDDCANYVNMESNITFETIQPGGDPNRPDVTRRIINNEVCVPDGQTIILGGLRRKISDDTKTAIPFIGELPGIGKLFSFSQWQDDSVEMFIFITPKIITDPTCELERIKITEMTRRPGDIPYFMAQLVEAREREKNRHLSGTMTLLFGPKPDRFYFPLEEYDGRCCP